jgi:DNA polymerase III delta prime subunit
MNEKNENMEKEKVFKENQILIHKYQPRYFKDFEMDPKMTQMLKALVEIDDLNILISGNMGSGKTTLLNAIVREYYKDIPLSLVNDNILYINSLKEQGIHYYRNDVKTFCQTNSSILKKKKFVVLDDMDTINEQSQQIFRNCIDKYRHNVHFISTCTNHQKIIETLQSRLIGIKIKPLRRDDLNVIMKKILKEENIIMDENVSQFILNMSNNTTKILIHYLEKCKLLDCLITQDIAKSICTNICLTCFQEFNEYLDKKKLTNAIQLLYSIYDQGYSVMDILDNYFLFVKMTDTLSEEQKYKIIPYLCKYISVFHNVHEDEIELALFTNNLILCFS